MFDIKTRPIIVQLDVYLFNVALSTSISIKGPGREDCTTKALGKPVGLVRGLSECWTC